MSPARPRDIGTAAETAVVRFLRTAGFPHAERRSLRGAFDAGDITGTPGLAWEVKGGAAARAASDRLITAWLEETEQERINAGADVGVLVVVRTGIGPVNAGRWWAVLRLHQLTDLSHDEGWHSWVAKVPELSTRPVRLHLATATRFLLGAGYGDQEHLARREEAAAIG